jgi:hypothetical protein
MECSHYMKNSEAPHVPLRLARTKQLLTHINKTFGEGRCSRYWRTTVAVTLPTRINKTFGQCVLLSLTLRVSPAHQAAAYSIPQDLCCCRRCRGSHACAPSQRCASSQPKQVASLWSLTSFRFTLQYRACKHRWPCLLPLLYMLLWQAVSLGRSFYLAPSLFTALHCTFMPAIAGGLAFCRRWLDRPDGGSAFTNGATGGQQVNNRAWLCI